MIDDETLVNHNKRGFIPGPKETCEDFLQRIEICTNLRQDPRSFFDDILPFSLDEKIKKPLMSWTCTRLLDLYDVSPDWIAAFFSNEKLQFFQGAATWIFCAEDNKSIKIPLLQVRKKLKKGMLFGLYQLDEVLLHESAHAVRVAYDEPIFEEYFAYMSSRSIFRKIFGPIIRHGYESIIFLCLLSSCFLFQWMHDGLFLLSVLGTTIFLSLGLFRLCKNRIKIIKTYRKLKKIVLSKRKAMAVLFRLTDEEIINFSKWPLRNIEDFIKTQNPSSLRWRVIRLTYFAE